MQYRHKDWRRGLYRSRNGMIFGVCRGMADYLNFSVIGMRVIWILVFIFTGFFPVIVIYFVAAVLMKPEPMLPFEAEQDREFYDSYTSSRSLAIGRLKRTFDNLERRIRRMESIVTSRDFDWERRLNK